jgi:AraC family transcriptional regulator
VSSGTYPIGGVSAIDLQEEPAVLLPNPFDTLVLYVTQAALDEVAYAHRAPRVAQLVWQQGAFDPVVYHLGKTLLSTPEGPQQASRIFLDQVLYALNCHFVFSYAGAPVSVSPFRGGLSLQQMRRATAFLEAHLDGNISLQQIADVCGLSVSHFARAFKTSFRRPPYRWLIERRVDMARSLLRDSNLPLTDIATQCGFADQSALIRVFKRIHGLTPGKWRRTTNTGYGG